jgi:hypothetical protein
MGEISGLTSLMGASAPPSHAPAAKPQNIPKACRLRSRVRLELGSETAGRLGSSELNGVYPAGILRQGARKRESRSECRLRWLGTCCGNCARLGSPIGRLEREVVNLRCHLRDGSGRSQRGKGLDSYQLLFTAQGNHGVHTRSFPGRKKTGSQSGDR